MREKALEGKVNASEPRTLVKGTTSVQEKASELFSCDYSKEKRGGWPRGVGDKTRPCCSNCTQMRRCTLGGHACAAASTRSAQPSGGRGPWDFEGEGTLLLAGLPLLAPRKAAVAGPPWAPAELRPSAGRSPTEAALGGAGLSRSLLDAT